MFAVIQLSAQQAMKLEECRSLALQNNNKLRMKGEQLAATQSLRRSAYTQFLPSFSFTADYTRLNKQFSLFSEDKMLPIVPYTAINPETGQVDVNSFNTPSVAVSTFVIDPSTGQPYTDYNGNPVFRNYAWLPADQATMGQKDNYFFNLGMVQPVFTGGKIREIYRMSQIAESLASESQNLESNELLFKVEEYYWRVVSLREKVRLATTYRDLILALITDLENYQAEGIITGNDLLKAKIKLNEADLDVMRASNGLKLSVMALNQIIGLDMNAPFIPADSIVPMAGLPIEDVQALIDQARTQRPEMGMMDLKLQLSESELRLSRSRFMPDIGLTANYFYINPSPYQGFDNVFDHDWTVSIAMKLPLFHWGDRIQTMKAAQHNLEANRIEKQDAEQMIALEIQMTVNAYNESLQKIVLCEIGLQQATENLRISENQFAEGLIKANDLLEAQTLWLESYTKAIEARAEAITNKMKLNKAIGNILSI